MANLTREQRAYPLFAPDCRHTAHLPRLPQWTKADLTAIVRAILDGCRIDTDGLSVGEPHATTGFAGEPLLSLSIYWDTKQAETTAPRAYQLAEHFRGIGKVLALVNKLAAR